MATTSPDNIQYPVNSDQVAPLASHFKNLADSTQAALNNKVDDNDARLSDERTPLDNSVTSAKIVDGTIVEADLADGAVTSAKILDGTIQSTDLDVLDYVKFDTTYTGGSTQPGMINWNDTDGTLEFQLKGGNVTLQVGQEQVVRVKNDTGATLSNGKAVYISGSNGNNLLADYANATSEPKSSGTIGITTEDINSNGHGYVTTFGLVRNINTAGLTEGAPVWLSTTDGGFTSTRPTAPNHSVVLGFCLRASATVGVIFVRVDNGWELDELHNVLISSPVNGQALTYDNGVWKNATPASSLADLSDVEITAPLLDRQVLQYDDAVNKFVNVVASGGVTVAASAPSISTALEGDAWFDSNDGTLYVCYIDGDSTKQWVQVQANSALEGSILARLGSLESQAIAYGQLSPNYVINGGFDYLQRSQSYTITGSHFSHRTADRWILSCTASGSTSITNSINAFPDGGVAVSGQDLRFFMRSNVTTVGTATNYGFINRIEDVRTLAGKTATLSFWVRGTQSTTITPYLIQYFGSGGSSDVVVTGTTQSIGTTWQRKSITLTVPSVDSKTINNADCFLQVQLNVNSVTLGTLDIAGVQLEAGSVATNFRRAGGTLQGELAACQRYYYRQGGEGTVQVMTPIGYADSTTTAIFDLQLPVKMRAIPSSIEYSTLWASSGPSNFSITSMSLLGNTSSTIARLYASASGLTQWRNYGIVAANSTSAFLAINAEL